MAITIEVTNRFEFVPGAKIAERATVDLVVEMIGNGDVIVYLNFRRGTRHELRVRLWPELTRSNLPKPRKNRQKWEEAGELVSDDEFLPNDAWLYKIMPQVIADWEFRAKRPIASSDGADLDFVIIRPEGTLRPRTTFDSNYKERISEFVEFTDIK